MCVFPCSCVCEYSVCLWVNAPLGVCVFPVCMRVFAGASGWAPLYCSSYAEGTILSVSLCRSASSDGPSILLSYLERHTVRCKREAGRFFSLHLSPPPLHLYLPAAPCAQPVHTFLLPPLRYVLDAQCYSIWTICWGRTEPNRVIAMYSLPGLSSAASWLSDFTENQYHARNQTG